MDYLARLSSQNRKFVSELGQMAAHNGVAAYLVGGIVRDLILGCASGDLDVVVEADVSRWVTAWAKRWKAKVVAHGEFKTATLHLPSGSRVDLTSARRESYAFSGALPNVQLSQLKDDLFRRDFTINAIAISIHPKSWGQLRDDFGGMQDIKKKIVRVLHADSFKDDPTRVLRAIRFEQRLEFRMDPQTEKLLRNAIKAKFASRVTPERYWQEFRKFFVEPAPEKALRRAYELGGLSFIAPGYKLNPDRQIKRLTTMLARLKKSKSRGSIDRESVYLAVLFQGLPQDKVEGISRRFNFSYGVREVLAHIVGWVQKEQVLCQRSYAPSRIYATLEKMPEESLLACQVLMGSLRAKKRIDNYLKVYKNIRLQLTGKDLLNLGIPEGRLLGSALKELHRQKLDGKIKTRSAEIRLAREFLTGVRKEKRYG